MQGSINNFNIVLEAMKAKAKNQEKEIDNLKKQKEKRRLHEEHKEEEPIARGLGNMRSDQEICMQADQLLYGHGCSKNIPQAINLYKKSAAQGNVKAFVALGRLLEQGLGVKKDIKQAYQYYKQAAQAQDPQALFKMGQFLQKGNIQSEQQDQGQFKERDLKPNIKRAIQIYQRAAEGGSSQAMTHLGLMYQKGEEIKQDLVIARELYQGAAKQNNPQGLNHLGALYFKHNRDYVKALEYFTKASDLGSAQGKNNLGICFEFGYGIAVPDQQQAFRLYEESAGLNYAPAMANLGYQYIKMAKLQQNRNDEQNLYAQGGEWLRSALHRDKSLTQALMILAGLYQKGLGNDQNFKMAYKYYKQGIVFCEIYQMLRMAGQKGYGKAYTKCGDLLYCGLGVIKANKTEAIQYYKKAHRSGDTQALNNIGLIYESGYDGIPPDYEKALDCYECAIEENNADAMFNYAILKSSGKIPAQDDNQNNEQNQQQIRDLLIKSAKFGSNDAKQLLISNNIISSFDQITKYKQPTQQDNLKTKRSTAAAPYNFESPQLVSKASPSNQFITSKKQYNNNPQSIRQQTRHTPTADSVDFDHQLSLENKKYPDKQNSQVFKHSNLTRMMSDQLLDDLPDVPKNRVNAKVEKHFMRDQRLSKIEKKRPALQLQ